MGRLLMPDRIALYLDFENVHRVGHGLYARGRERYACVPEPSLIADVSIHVPGACDWRAGAV